MAIYHKIVVPTRIQSLPNNLVGIELRRGKGQFGEWVLLSDNRGNKFFVGSKFLIPSTANEFFICDIETPLNKIKGYDKKYDLSIEKLKKNFSNFDELSRSEKLLRIYDLIRQYLCSCFYKRENGWNTTERSSIFLACEDSFPTPALFSFSGLEGANITHEHESLPNVKFVSTVNIDVNKHLESSLDNIEKMSVGCLLCHIPINISAIDKFTTERYDFSSNVLLDVAINKIDSKTVNITLSRNKISSIMKEIQDFMQTNAK